MKTIDFSFPGGLRTTQKILEEMQDGYQGPLRGLAGIGDADNYIIKGCVLSGDEPEYAMTAGWLYYNGDVVYCPGGSFESSNRVDVGFHFVELDDADRERAYADGEIRMPFSHVRAIPVDTSTVDDFVLYDDLFRARLPYDTIAEYEYMAKVTTTVTTDSAAVGYQTSVRGRRSNLDYTMEFGIDVNINRPDSIGVTPPARRAVDTGIDIPAGWAGAICLGAIPCYQIPVITTISSGGVVQIAAATTGDPIYDVVVQIIARRIWLHVTKSDAAFPAYRACGYFKTIGWTEW
jgi:hypothetical protein